MSNVVFPSLPGLKWGVRRSPEWNTTKREAVSGREFRLANRTYPRYLYSLSYEFLRDVRAGVDELRNLVGFFNARKGSFDSFLFNDPDDNAASAQNFGTGTGTQAAFQLMRSFGAADDPVYNVNGAPQIYKAGVLQTVTTHYTVSSSGLVTFVTPPAIGQALTWTGAFYWRCRFERDSVDFEKFLRDLWELREITFKTDSP